MNWKKWIGMGALLVGAVFGGGATVLGASPEESQSAEVEALLETELPSESADGREGEMREKPSFTDTYPGKLVPFVGMAVAVLIVWIVMAMVQNTDRYRHETIRQYLEKGVEVPHELLVDSGNPQTWKPTSDLRKAMIWLAVGIGVGLTGYIFSGSPRALALGLIFDCIGLGYLIVWKIEPQKQVVER